MKVLFFRTILCSFIASFLLLTSCKKTVVDNNTTTPAPSATTGMLKKVHTDNGIGVTIDEEFVYNSNNLVLSRRVTEIGNYTPPMGKSTRIYFTTFYYSGSDPKPIKDSTYLTAVDSGTTSIYRSNTNSATFYYYDSINQLKKSESFVGGNLVYSRICTYPTNKKTESYYSNNSDGTIGYTYKDTFAINSQNQITQWLSYGTNATSPGTPLITKYDYEFDSKKNPYSDLNIAKYDTRGSDSAYYGQYIHFAVPNNLQKLSFYSVQNGVPDALYRLSNYTYAYNAKNYPVSGVEKKNTYFFGTSSSTTSTINYTYEYY